MTGFVGQDRKAFSLSPIRWRWRTRLALATAVPFLAVGLWVAWSFLRPNPTGFGPTVGVAAPVLDAPALRQFTVDARSRRQWAYFSFSKGAVVATTQDALDWDVAFRRTDILTNGGVTNPAGGVGAVDLGEVPLASALAPGGAFAGDARDDERGVENPELHRWYSYNWTTHVVSSRNHSYALKTVDGDVVLLTFVSYYCADGAAGCITFQYKSAPQAGTGTAE